MSLAADVIRGTQVDDVLFAAVALVVALTTLAALAHKPPIRQVGRFFGWIFSRLIGEPLATWYTRTFAEHAEPIVRAAVETAVTPIRDEVATFGNELRDHVREEAAHDEAFAQWRARVDIALTNLQRDAADDAMHARPKEIPA